MAKVKVLRLKPNDQKKLQRLTKSGTLKSRKLNRCRILLLSAKGKSKKEIAQILNLSQGTVITTCKRYKEGNLENALNERPRSGAPSIFSGKDKAKITALACSTPPEGTGRWSLRLLADRAIELNIVDDISYGTVRNILKKTNLSHT